MELNEQENKTMPSNEFDEAEEWELDADDDLYDSEYDKLSEAEQWETDQREAFNDRLEMFRNEY